MQQAKILMRLKEKPEGVAAIETAEVTVLKDQISVLTEQVAALTAKQTRVTQGWIQGGHGGQKTPLPESYWESLKSGVVP